MDSEGLSRRGLLSTGTAAAAGLAGCSSRLNLGGTTPPEITLVAPIERPPEAGEALEDVAIEAVPQGEGFLVATRVENLIHDGEVQFTADVGVYGPGDDLVEDVQGDTIDEVDPDSETYEFWSRLRTEQYPPGAYELRVVVDDRQTDRSDEASGAVTVTTIPVREAFDVYREAAATTRDAVETYDRGVAAYQEDDYEAARDAFEAAAEGFEAAVAGFEAAEPVAPDSIVAENAVIAAERQRLRRQVATAFAEAAAARLDGDDGRASDRENDVAALLDELEATERPTPISEIREEIESQ